MKTEKQKLLNYIWEMYDSFTIINWEINSEDKYIAFLELCKPMKNPMLWNPVWVNISHVMSDIKKQKEALSKLKKINENK